MKPYKLNRPLTALTLCGSLLNSTPVAHASLMMTLDDLGTLGVIETIVVDNIPAGTPTPFGSSICCGPWE